MVPIVILHFQMYGHDEDDDAAANRWMTMASWLSRLKRKISMRLKRRISMLKEEQIRESLLTFWLTDWR